MTDPVENLTSELRRGTLVLTVLSQLDRKQYGYSLSQSLAEPLPPRYEAAKSVFQRTWPVRQSKASTRSTLLWR